MATENYRPLPPYLNHGCGYGIPGQPPRGMQPPADFTPPPGFAEMAKREEEEKEARRLLADQFLSAAAEYNGLSLNYRLYVPAELEEGKKYPLVLFLHGGGERGDDNLTQLIANDGAVIWLKDQMEDPELKCFILAPQSPDGEPGWLEKHLLAVSKALDDVTDAYPVDTDRLYLTGMSMGGVGSWRMNYMFPTRFAAVVPICSAGGMDENRNIDPTAIDALADAFMDKPLWLFHAADDAVVPCDTSRCLTQALVQRGRKLGEDFFFTEYPAECGYNHGSWNPAYRWVLMRRWMFQQTTAPAPMPGPPKGGDMPFPVDFEEMMRREAEEKAARKVWLDRFVPGVCISSDVNVPYQLYIPQDKTEKLPLVVILHGIGGCGCDNVGQITDNDGVIDWVKAQDNGTLSPCYLMAPQCPYPIPNLKWEDEYLTLVGREILSICEKYAVDTDRIYLTGLSLGGYGCWNLNRMFPEMFAAVVPCCPACLKGTMMNSVIDYAGMDLCVPALLKKPVWMFHAEDDMAVPVDTTKGMIRRFRDAGRQEGDDFHVTLYPAEQGHNHFCWGPAYKDADMFAWLMAQKKQ